LENLLIQVNPTSAKNHASVDTLEVPESASNDDDIIQQTHKTYKLILKFSNQNAFWVFSLSFACFFIVYWGWLLSKSGYFNWSVNALFNAVDEHSQLYRMIEL